MIVPPGQNRAAEDAHRAEDGQPKQSRCNDGRKQVRRLQVVSSQQNHLSEAVPFCSIAGEKLTHDRSDDSHSTGDPGSRHYVRYRCREPQLHPDFPSTRPIQVKQVQKVGLDGQHARGRVGDNWKQADDERDDRDAFEAMTTPILYSFAKNTTGKNEN